MTQDGDYPCGHPRDIHICEHDCDNFWCKVSRREPMPMPDEADD